MRITRARLATALSIVEEHGFGGMEYASAVDAVLNIPYQSRKMRWTVRRSPHFTPDEFRNFMSYAARAKLVDAGKDTERLVVGQYHENSWVLRLTLKGYEFVEDHDRPILHRWASNIWSNFPTVVLSILGALAVSWALFYLGPPV